MTDFQSTKKHQQLSKTHGIVTRPQMVEPDPLHRAK